VSPPSQTSGDSRYNSFVREVSVKCSKADACKDKSAENLNTYAVYTTDYCKNYQDTSEYLAMSSAKLICNDVNCSAQISNFVNSDGGTDLSSIIAGDYTLIVFIDSNDDKMISKHEPYFCSDNVSLDFQKKNTVLEVEVRKKWKD